MIAVGGKAISKNPSNATPIDPKVHKLNSEKINFISNIVVVETLTKFYKTLY